MDDNHTAATGAVPASADRTEASPPSVAPASAATFHPRSGRWVAFAVVALALVMGALFFFGRRSRATADDTLAASTDQEAMQAPAVEVAPVVRAESVKSIILPGEARPFYETTLYARTNGYLRKWLVDIGDPVEEGQLLATIETPELDDQIKESEAKLGSLRSEVTLAKAAADFAKTSHDRWNTDDGVVSQQERDQKKSELDSSLARLEVSKARVNLGEAELQGLRTLEGFKSVTAPFKGIITERHVDIGHLVTAGSASSTTPLFKIVQYDQLRVMVDVPQGVASEVSVGMPASAFAPEHAERTYEGTVDRTAGAVDPKTRTLRIEVLVPNPDHSLLPGTYLQVALQIKRPQPPLRIPAAALTMRSSGPQAAVVLPNGTVVFRALNIEQDLGDYVEVRGGLSEGDIVALNISHDTLDGDHVVPRQPREPAPGGRTNVVVPVAHEAAMAKP